jgi:hypothetical protein
MLLGAATTSRNPAPDPPPEAPEAPEAPPEVDAGFVIVDSILLRFRFRRRQNGRHDLRLEPAASMRSVAEWFIVALAATAETYNRATSEVVFITGAVVDFDIALDPQRAVVVYSDFRRHRFNLIYLIYTPGLVLIPGRGRQETLRRPSSKP